MSRITDEINWELDKQIIKPRLEEDEFLNEDQYSTHIREEFAQWIVEQFRKERNIL